MGMRGTLQQAILIIAAFALVGCGGDKHDSTITGSAVPGAPTAAGAEAPTTALGQQLEIADGGATVDVTVADLRPAGDHKQVTVTLRGVSGVYHAGPRAFTAWTADGDQLDADNAPGDLPSTDVHPGQTLSGTAVFDVRPGGVVQRIVMQQPLRGKLGTWTVPGVTPTAGPLMSPTSSVPVAHGTLGQLCAPPGDNHAVAADGTPLKCTSTGGTNPPHWVRSVPVLGTAPIGSPCDPSAQGVMLAPDGRDMLCVAPPVPTGITTTASAPKHGTWQTVQ